MKPKCSQPPSILKILLLTMIICTGVFFFCGDSYYGKVREKVYEAVTKPIGATVDAYSTLWCNINININNALNCEVHIQTDVPSISQCSVELGSGIGNFCGAL